jgi:phosphohistidine phosphatase
MRLSRAAKMGNSEFNRLYLVRHGETVASHMDPDPPLSPKGREETEAVAKILQRTSIEIEEIQHSTKARARQTAEIFNQTLALNLTLIAKKNLTPMDPVAPVIQEIQAFDRNVMLVSHLPLVEKILCALVLENETKSPVAIVCACVICLKMKDFLWYIDWVISPHLTQL